MSAPEYTEIGKTEATYRDIRDEDGNITAAMVNSQVLVACLKCGAAVADTEAHDRFHTTLQRMQMGFPIGFGGPDSI